MKRSRTFCPILLVSAGLCITTSAAGSEPSNFKKDKGAFDKSFALQAEDLLPIPPRSDGRKQLVIIEYPAFVADDALEAASTAYSMICQSEDSRDKATLVNALVRTKYVVATLVNQIQSNVGENVTVLAMPQVIGHYGLVPDELGTKNVIDEIPQADATINFFAYVDACKGGKAGSFAKAIVPGIVASTYRKHRSTDLHRRQMPNAVTDRLLGGNVADGGVGLRYSAVSPLLDTTNSGSKGLAYFVDGYYAFKTEVPKKKREPIPYFYTTLPFEIDKILILPTAALELAEDQAAGRFTLLDSSVFLKIVRGILLERQKDVVDKSEFISTEVRELYPIMDISWSSKTASPELLNFVEATRNVEIQWLQRFLNGNLQEQWGGTFGQSVTEAIKAEIAVKNSTWKALGAGLLSGVALGSMGMDTTSASMHALDVAAKIETQSTQHFENIYGPLSAELSTFTLSTGTATWEITANTHAELRKALQDKYVEAFEANDAVSKKP